MAGKKAKRGRATGEGQLLVMLHGAPSASGVQSTTDHGVNFSTVS